MPDESSVEKKSTLRPAFELKISGRLAMVALGYIPFLHVSATIAAVALAALRGGTLLAIAVALVAVYLLPPLAAQVVRPRSSLSAERYLVGSPGFLKWWYASQCQVIYNRLPMLEELLRLVPGLYSVWLRLWGARVGALVYWSPRVNIFDRSFLEIHDRVVIGADTKICPHYLSRSPEGKMQLVLSPVVIGHDALIGGSTLLPAGVRVEPCEQTPGFKPMAPFAHFRDGQHIRTVRFSKEGHNE